MANATEGLKMRAKIHQFNFGECVLLVTLLRGVSEAWQKQKLNWIGLKSVQIETLHLDHSRNFVLQREEEK